MQVFRLDTSSTNQYDWKELMSGSMSIRKDEQVGKNIKNPPQPHNSQ